MTFLYIYLVMILVCFVVVSWYMLYEGDFHLFEAFASSLLWWYTLPSLYEHHMGKSGKLSTSAKIQEWYDRTFKESEE